RSRTIRGGPTGLAAADPDTCCARRVADAGTPRADPSAGAASAIDAAPTPASSTNTRQLTPVIEASSLAPEDLRDHHHLPQHRGALPGTVCLGDHRRSHRRSAHRADPLTWPPEHCGRWLSGLASW